MKYSGVRITVSLLASLWFTCLAACQRPCFPCADFFQVYLAYRLGAVTSTSQPGHRRKATVWRSTDLSLRLYIGQSRGQSRYFSFFTCREKYSFGIEVVFLCSLLSVSFKVPLLTYFCDTRWHGRALIFLILSGRALVLRKAPKQQCQLLGDPVSIQIAEKGLVKHWGRTKRAILS